MPGWRGHGGGWVAMIYWVCNHCDFRNESVVALEEHIDAAHADEAWKYDVSRLKCRDRDCDNHTSSETYPWCKEHAPESKSR